MRITCDNVSKLKPKAQIELLQKIVDGAKELDEKNDDLGAIQFILFHVIDQLDECEDQFGSEGWRHSILGED